MKKKADEINSYHLKNQLAEDQFRLNHIGHEGNVNDRMSNMRARVNRYRFNMNVNKNDDAVIALNYDDTANFDPPLEDNQLERTFNVISGMQRLVHLDLKGSPPKLAYLRSFVPFIKSAGATGLLIEYDDFFPYNSELETIRNQNHYTKQELQQLFNLLADNNMQVVPLMQTLGSMEYLLKLKQFSQYRDVPHYFDLINPCLNETYEKILYNMVDQMLDIHPSSIQYIHIGSGRTRSFASVNTPKCQALKLNNADDFFLHHVNLMTEYIRKKRSTLKVMIWDDMIRAGQANIKFRQLRSRVIPVISSFTDYLDIDIKLLKKYEKMFNEFWIASAYKGMGQPLEIIPNAHVYYQNQLSWLSMVNQLENSYKLKGIALMGPSRHDHMQAVCEMLPAAVPSLVLCLQTLNNFDQSESKIFKNSRILTDCDSSRTLTGFVLNSDMLMRDKLSLDNLTQFEHIYSCKFPGADIYTWLLDLKLTSSFFLDQHTKHMSHLNEFNLKYKLFSALDYDYAVNTLYPALQKKFETLASRGEKEFDKIFYGDLYEEITNVYILKPIKTIKERLAELNKTSKPEFAPVRPFNKIEQTII